MTTRNSNRGVSSLRDKEPSPFTPGAPVPLKLFVGRSSQIECLQNYARQACSGRQESVFLSGDRGIGKSSLAHFVSELFSKDQNMLGVHAFLGGVSTTDELVRRVFEQVLKETHSQPWFNKIKDLFGKHIRNVGLFGITVEFTPSPDQLSGLKGEFATALKNLLDRIADQRSGLLVVLDDINGLANQADFAAWYKSLVDDIATRDRPLPVLLMLCGLPEIRDSLSSLQPSLMRVFRVVDIERLSDEDVTEFLQQAFRTVNVTVDRDAMETMAHFSSGLPALMHEIGDATYWVDTDRRIDLQDALSGVALAAEVVGKKYLDPSVYRAIRSERYRAILGKLVTRPADVSFVKREVDNRLNAQEKKVLHNFLQRMKKLGVIESDTERGRGAYRFVNRIFPVYISIQGST